MYHDYEFKEGDPDYDCFGKLIDLETEKEIEEMDVDIISSMFELHKDLPPLPEVLFDSGFILPKNERKIGHVDAIWQYESDEKGDRTAKYSRESWDTMWNRSDHYHIDVEYNVKDDLTATYVYRMCEQDYGRRKTHEKRCSVIKNGNTIIEYTKSFPK